jgi:hypothetical protein
MLCVAIDIQVVAQQWPVRSPCSLVAAAVSSLPLARQVDSALNRHAVGRRIKAAGRVCTLNVKAL